MTPKDLYSPKEKALEIFNKMCNSVDELLPLDVKQCALIAVDVIIFELKIRNCSIKYFEEVKQEILKL
jgi:hypothetical protein